MARIPQHTLHKYERIHAINLLTNLGRVAEFPSRRGAGLGWSHPAFDVLLRGGVHVEIEFLVLLGIGFIPAEESPPFHPCFSVTGFKMRPIARTICSQRDVCATSCRLPNGVSR
jgi:hypothetical protein